MKKGPILCTFVFLVSTALFPDAVKPNALFDFFIPWDDDTPSAMNLSGLSDAPAGKSGYVRAGPDGHLYSDAGRVRFWGVTFSAAANFPDHASASKIARHLAKFGVNLVRFFNMDYRQSPDGIWVTTSADRTLDARQLDKLDFFFAELKKNGVYADLNLLTDRPFNRLNDLSPDIDLIDDWKTRAALGFFDRPIMELQKRYARDLLTHNNPYTGTTYAEEPAVALVEINNENGLAHEFLRGGLDSLPPHYRNELKDMWNGWLEKRYADNAALSAAWGVKKLPMGDEMLADVDFSSAQTSRWIVENNGGAKTSQSVAKEGPGGRRAIRIKVNVPGNEDWHVQFNQPGLEVEAGVPYNLSFYAKADTVSMISVEIAAAHDPWQNLGFKTAVKLARDWTRFDFKSFVLDGGDSNARLNFSNLGTKSQSIWIAGVSLRKGGIVGLASNETLKSSGIDPFESNKLGFRTQAARKDWYAFLLDVESRYWKEMYDFLKKELKVRSVVYGAIIGSSTPTLMAELDAVDAHGYWNHPVFPVQQWDMSDWYIKNAAMVNNPYYSTISDMAVRRVKGKPQLVTEYNHPYPDSFAAEGFLILSAYAGFQDWDVLVPFAYCARLNDWDLKKIPNFFDIDQNPNLLASFVPAAAAFRRFDVKPAEKEITVAIDRQKELDLMLGTILWKLVDAENAGIPRLNGYLHRLAMEIVPEGAAKARAAPDTPETGASQTIFASDTGELLWDVSTKGKGVFTANSARTKMVVGFSGDKSFTLGDVVIKPGETIQGGFSVIAATVMDGDSFNGAKRILVTALGAEMNDGTFWRRYPDKDIQFPPPDGERVTLRTGFGVAPSRVEGIRAIIGLPVPADRTKAWALDSRGNRTAQIAVSGDSRSSSIAIGPSYRALWYEVEIAQ